jgi:hypothetical protein
MTGAAIPFVLATYLLAAALLVTGVRRGEWANTMAGIIVVVALTTALTA